MQVRKHQLNQDDLALLLLIIKDVNYWKTLKTKGYGVPAGIARMQKIVAAKKDMNDFDLVDKLSVEAKKRLETEDDKRQKPTKLLYHLLTELETGTSRELFDALKADYLTYQCAIEGGIPIDLLNGEHDPTAMLITDKSYSDFTTLELVRKLFMHQCNKSYRLAADFGQNTMFPQSTYYCDLDNIEKEKLYHGPQKKIIKAMFEKEYPSLIEAFDNYLTNVYLKNENIFMRDCGIRGLFGILVQIQNNPWKVSGKTKDGIEINVQIDSNEDLDQRCMCICKTALSDKYFSRVLTDLHTVELVVDIMRRNVPEKELRKVLFEKLSQPSVFSKLVKTEEDAETIERIIPGIRKNYLVKQMELGRKFDSESHLFKKPKDIVNTLAEADAADKNKSTKHNK